MQNYILRQKRKVDEMVDYVVWFENLEIAILNINIIKRTYLLDKLGFLKILKDKDMQVGLLNFY